MKIAFACYLVVEIWLIGFGVVYLSRQEFMSYHAAAVGMPWAEVPAPFKVLLFAFLKIVAGAWLALAIAFGAILFVPFRQGAAWAKWALGASGVVWMSSSLFATTYVTLNSAAQAPWRESAAGLALVLIAIVTAALDSPNR